MKKDVWLSIYSYQHLLGCDEEQAALDTAATLYKRNGKYFIIYQESELTGLEGTQTTLKLEGKQVTLIRTGAFVSHMMFRENERRVGLYQTPFGQQMTITTQTSSVQNSVGDSGGELVIDYTIEVDNSMMGVYHFEMYVTTP